MLLLLSVLLLLLLLLLSLLWTEKAELSVMKYIFPTLCIETQT